jgi:hypothetical protein
MGQSSLALLLVAAIASTDGACAGKTKNNSERVPPVQMTAAQDHQRLMELLHITALRPGADGNHPDAPNAANYDESKANPFPDLPDALRFEVFHNLRASFLPPGLAGRDWFAAVQDNPQSKLGSDEHRSGDERRCARSHQEADRPRR